MDGHRNAKVERKGARDGEEIWDPSQNVSGERRFLPRELECWEIAQPPTLRIQAKCPVSMSEMLHHRSGYVTEPRDFMGFGDGLQDPKNSLEIQGFVPSPPGPAPSLRI
jgi:hypothetical protein